MSARRPPPRILGLGTVAVDDLLHVPEYPSADGKAPILATGRSCGGQVGTALAAAARLGASTEWAGTLGRDPLSRFLLQAFARSGVGTRRLARRERARPIHSVIVEERAGGTRTIFFDRAGVQPFPLALIRPRLLRGADVLLVDQLGEEACLRAARLARRLAIPVVGDFEWKDRPRMADLLAATDHLLLSREFALGLTGVSSPAAAARELHRRHPRACTAVTDGREGCHFVTRASFPAVLHLAAFRVRAVSTTGCGDVFHGAYAVALAEGQPPEAALRFAAAASALYASRPNGWEHLPDRHEVSALLASRGGPA
jgi:sugar/nucleoside kinase (ribokinase family)